jgi:hypothetical protein
VICATVPRMGWFGKKKKTEPTPEMFQAKLDAFVDEQVDAMGSYVCTQCGDEHVAVELAFRNPDLAERLDAASDDPDDEVVIAGHAFVRGTLRVPIRGSERDFAVGIWAEIVNADEAYLANQLCIEGPLLGARVRHVAGKPGFRPTFELVDHPLARAQREGVTLEVANRWRSAEAHRGEPEPIGERSRAKLATHGWELVGAEEANRERCTETFVPGDFAKILVRLLTVGEDGEPEPFNAGWWLAVDHVDGMRISGTLHSAVPVAATVFTGTRMWPAPDEIFARQKPDS